MVQPVWVVTDRVEGETFAAMFAALDATTAERVGPARPHPLVVPIRNEAGQVTGGLWGCTLYAWLHIQMLVVPEPMRGQGLGSNVVQVAEDEAIARGCIGAVVDSFSFQAGGFYRKLGYARFASLEDCPPGHQRMYFFKRLS